MHIQRKAQLQSSLPSYRCQLLNKHTAAAAAAGLAGMYLLKIRTAGVWQGVEPPRHHSRPQLLDIVGLKGLPAGPAWSVQPWLPATMLPCHCCLVIVGGV